MGDKSYTQMDTMVRIKIDGQHYDLKFHSLKIEQGLYSHSEMFLETGIGLKNEADVNVVDAAKDWLGATLEVEMYDKIQSSISKKYKGSICKITTDGQSMKLHAFSEDYVLTAARKYYSYVDSDVNAIVKDIISRASLENVKITAKSGSHKFKFFQQYNESDYECLKRLARYDGCAFFHDGEAFYYGKEIGVTGEVKLKEEEIKDLSIDLELKNTSFKGAAYDYGKHSEPKDSESQATPFSPKHDFTSAIKSKSDKIFKNVVEEFFAEPFKDKTGIENFMKDRQDYIAGDMVRIKGSVSNPTVAVGKKISCAGDDFIGEPVVVVYLKAVFEDNVYTAEFEAIEDGATIKPELKSDVMFMPKLQPAIVTNNEDPDGLGKVEIKYLWDTKGQSLAWARLSQPGAGGKSGDASHGTHFTPRVGDHVLVEFEKGDPSLPIIIGAMYHSESKPYFNKDGKEEYLIVRTPGQSMIRILDTNGSEELVIDMAGGQTNISLGLHGKDDKPQISMTASGGTIIVKAKDISFTADEKFEVKAKEITMTTDADMKFKAGGNHSLEVTGNSEDKISGNKKINSSGNLDMAASISGTFKTSASCEIKSAQVSVNGSALTEVKGGMVKIN